MTDATIMDEMRARLGPRLAHERLRLDRRNARDRAKRRLRGLKVTGRPAVVTIRPSEERLAERDAVLSAGPQSLTATTFGDPPPGRSALDQRGGRR